MKSTKEQNKMFVSSVQKSFTLPCSPFEDLQVASLAYVTVPVVTEATDSVMPSHLLVTGPRSACCERMCGLPVVTATGDVRSSPPCPVFITPSSLLTTS